MNPKLTNIGNDCLVFFRTITDLEQLSPSIDSKAWSFKDIKDDETDDTEARELLEDLQMHLRNHLPKDKLIDLEPIEWQKGGKITKHLDSFVNTFESKLKLMIDQSVQDRKTNNDGLYNETLRHLTLSKKISSNFKGREDLITRVKEFLEDRTSNHPLLVYGNSGSGKTSLMAKTFHLVC